MRKFCILMELVTALTMGPAFGQVDDEQEPTTPTEETMSAELAPDEEDNTPTPGMAAASSTQATKDMANWQNWIFAAGALVAAAVGVIVVATNTGSGSDHD